MDEVDETPVRYWGEALGGAVRASVDGYGRVASVRFDERLVGRLRPDLLGQGVVAALADATCDTTPQGW
jgi:DNA-binding protein YbaB